MINVGLVGFGLSGKVFHAPYIRAVHGLNLVAIARRSVAADPEYPGVDFVGSVDDLLIRKIDLVVVATPNSSHYSIAKQCLLAGKHVVIDKPFTSTLTEAVDLVQTAAEQKRLLTVFQNRRWDGDFLTVQKLLRENALGRLIMYESHFDRFRPELRDGNWKEEAMDGIGLLFDLGPHLIDQALVLFGVPDAVQADLRKEREGSTVVDAFDITLFYPRKRALLRATTIAAAVGARFSVHGTEGSFVKYGLDPQEDALKSGGKIGDAKTHNDAEEKYGVLTTRDGKRSIATSPGDYRKFYENVRDAIEGRAELAVTPEQALNVMRVIDLALAANETMCAQPWIY
jgi:predicted dehydrogenase